LNFVRSNNTWADTWWDWKMGADNKLRLGFSTVPQLTFQNGAVGIATDSPQNRLHIGDGDIRISRATGTWGPNLLLDGTKVGSGGMLWCITSSTASDVGGAGRLAFVSNYAARMVVDPSGNVGIGTTNPVNALQVNGNVASYTSGIPHVGNWKDYAGAAATAGDNLGSFSFIIQNASNYGYPTAAGIGGAIDQPGGVRPKGRVTFTISDGTALVERVRIDSSGNVGIGTTNPTNKLEVNGTIRTKEVIVETTGWSDFVFAPDYRLAPLSEVEAHIQAKGTLPGIPSAAEVAEHGVSVGDMQARMLAKIEELTLHQIALEKENAALKARVAILEKKSAN
jgi:hypothetical protein